jgi:hypothetical protein
MMLRINNGSYKYKNVDAINNVMLTYSWIQFLDVLLFILMWLYAYKHLVSKFSIQKCQVHPPCIECVSGTRLLTTQLSPTWDTSKVFLYITAYNINGDTSMHVIQGYVSITLPIVSTFLYLQHPFLKPGDFANTSVSKVLHFVQSVGLLNS